MTPTHNAARLTEGFGGTATMLQMINDLFTMIDPAGGGSATVDVAEQGIAMREYTRKEKARITAGTVAALVIVGWLAVIAVALMSAG